MLRRFTTVAVMATSLLGTTTMAADLTFTPTCDMYNMPVLKLSKLAAPDVSKKDAADKADIQLCAESYDINMGDRYTVCSFGGVGGQTNILIDRSKTKKNVLRLPNTKAGINTEAGCDLITFEYNPNMLMEPESVHTYYRVWDREHKTLLVPQDSND